MWSLKSITKKFKEHNLPNDAVLWNGVVCFFLALYVAVKLVFELTFILGFWLAFLVGILIFYISFEILTIVGIFVMEKFVELYRKRR